MNKTVTSKEEILRVCRNIAMSEGISSINIRNVASKCGISVGAMYNYFPSKADLLSNTVASIWMDIFHISGGEFPKDFIPCLEWIFKGIEIGRDKYPGFYAFHSVIFTSRNKSIGKAIMDEYLNHMKKSLLLALDNDKHVRFDAFNEVFTREIFIDTVISLIISQILTDQYNYAGIIEILKRSLY